MKKLLLFIVIFLELFLLFYSKEITKEFILTLNICIYTLMPNMFFQIMLSNLLINTEIYKYIPNKICNYLKLNKDEIFILLISIFSGYPNNSRLLSNSNNEYLNYVSNYVNPIFMICIVGKVYLNNRIIYIIYLSHIISNIIMLFLFKNKFNKSKVNINNNKNIYSESLGNTYNSLIIIFLNLLFVSILIALIKLLSNNTILIGLLEFSRGVYEISKLNMNNNLKGLLILIIITFGSISIHFQSISFNKKIKYIKYLFFRILNVFISIIIYFILLFLMNKI